MGAAISINCPCPACGGLNLPKARVNVPKTKGTLTMAFGRFNPPHAGHGQLMDIAAGSFRDSEEGSDYMIVPSKSAGDDKNPLDFATKVEAMKGMFPHHSTHISEDENFRTIIDVLK